MQHVVIGLGEIGQALATVFGCEGEDTGKDIILDKKRTKFLHIAFPFSKDFIGEVKKYQVKFSPMYTVIHSTVPIGTSKACFANHSPVRGVHPHLVEGLRTFDKFVGGPNCKAIAKEFKKFGINCLCTNVAANTEAMKLWDTTQYGVLIELNKEIHKFCQDNGLDFDVVYTQANRTYNEGYSKLNRPEVSRPFLQHTQGPIGGHCVVPNCHLLESDSAKLILKKDKKRRNAY